MSISDKKKKYYKLIMRFLTSFGMTGSSVLRRKVMGGFAAHDLPPLKVPECSVISSGARDLYLCIHKFVIGDGARDLDLFTR